MGAGREKGFTLLELLLSLTMMAVMVVIVFGTFRVGVRAWEKGERDIEVRHTQRTVLEQVRRQLASMSTRMLVNDGREPFFPVGSENKLRFISEVPLIHDNSFGLVYVEYRVEDGEDDTRVLKVFERNLVLLDASFFESEQDPEPDPEAFVAMIADIEGALLAYHNRPEEGETGEWLEAWQPEDEKTFPRAVRLTLVPGGTEPAMAVIAPIQWEEGR